MKLLKKLFGLEPQKTIVVVPAQHKFCPHCEKTKPLTDYNKHTGRKDGVQCWCRECANKAENKFRKNKFKSKIVRRSSLIPTKSYDNGAEYLNISITKVHRTEYIRLVEYARKHNLKMNDAYKKMIKDFLTLTA
jgi:hypothetical protein